MRQHVSRIVKVPWKTTSAVLRTVSVRLFSDHSPRRLPDAFQTLLVLTRRLIAAEGVYLSLADRRPAVTSDGRRTAFSAFRVQRGHLLLGHRRRTRRGVQYQSDCKVPPSSSGTVLCLAAAPTPSRRSPLLSHVTVNCQP